MATTKDLGDFVQVTASGGNTTVFVDADGPAGNAAVAPLVTSLASRRIFPTWSRAETLVPELGLGS